MRLNLLQKSISKVAFATKPKIPKRMAFEID
jgi:hypothetical protein